MIADRGAGRLAGLVYLVVVVTGIFSLAYVPSRIVAGVDPTATIASITASLPLFRMGIASLLVDQVAFLLLPLLLYRIMCDADRRLGVAMVVLAVVSVPIVLVATAHRMDVLALLGNPAAMAALPADALHAAVTGSFAAYRSGLAIASLFWGLWLLPFGWLVLKSGCLPRVLGALLILGGLGYVVDVFGTLLAPDYPDWTISSYMLLPAAAAEIGTTSWLLLFGTVPATLSRRGSRPA
jgi:hypothetical protein